MEIFRFSGQIRKVKIDMTGFGLFEFTRERFERRVAGINFGTTVAMPSRIREEGRVGEKIRVTEALAIKLLQRFEDRSIQIPIDGDLREELRKPERVTSPRGMVSIAATRDQAGHAGHFWSLAMAVDAAETTTPDITRVAVVQRPWRRPFFNTRKNGVSF